MTRRILVCGGRDFQDAQRLADVLDVVVRDDDIIVEGGARGADRLAYEYAATCNLIVEEYPADWKKNGKAAGPIRNQAMLDAGIDLVVVCPGGRGTADMVHRARKAGVPIRTLDC